MFSIGVIMFKLLHDRDPFTKNELFFGQQEYDDLLFDDHISQECRDFIDKLLDFRVRSRKTVEYALNNSWLNEIAPDL